MGLFAWRPSFPEALRRKETVTKRLSSSRTFIFITGLVALTAARIAAAAAAELEFDHVWIVVTHDAPERAALERAGLNISPNINRNDGQGTASVSAEFFNAYIELMWPDPTVSVAQGAERGVEKFKNRMNWRTSGWCPIGIALHRTGPATTLPFPTWSIAPDWMPKGTAIEILTARDDTKSKHRWKRMERRGRATCPAKPRG